MTHREHVLHRLNLDINKSYSLSELSHYSHVPENILQEVYNRGIGAYKTNPTSVRLKGSYVKNVNAPYKFKLSKEQWAMARVYSFLDGNPKHDNDLRRNKNKIQGGEKLGEGNQGCVIFPAIPCRLHHDERNLVSKLFFVSDREEVHELNPYLLKKLRMIDPYQERFIYSVFDDCDRIPLQDLSEETIRDIKRCYNVKDDFIMSKTTKDIVFSNQKYVNPLGDHFTKNDFNFLRESLMILHEYGISHGDLHTNNVMRGEHGQPVIIDFGLSKILHNYSDAEKQKYLQEDLQFLHDFMDNFHNRQLRKKRRERERSRSPVHKVNDLNKKLLF